MQSYFISAVATYVQISANADRPRDAIAQIADHAVHKAERSVWSRGDGRRRLLTALGHVHRRRQVF